MKRTLIAKKEKRGAIKVEDAQDLIEVAPIKPELYKEEPLTSLTTYSLYWLHLWEVRRTIEAISVLNWRLFPSKFSMVGFPQFPDAFRTNRSLLQCQPKYRNLLTGSAKKGFSLNEKGMRIAESLIKRIGPPYAADGQILKTDVITKISKQVKSTRTIDPYKEIDRVRKSRLFEKWKTDVMGERDIIHLHSLLEIFDHTPVKVRLSRLKDLIKSAEGISDDEVARFLEDIKQNFPAVFAK